MSSSSLPVGMQSLGESALLDALHGFDELRHSQGNRTGQDDRQSDANQHGGDEDVDDVPLQVGHGLGLTLGVANDIQRSFVRQGTDHHGRVGDDHAKANDDPKLQLALGQLGVSDRHSLVQADIE